jgi:hypothetical protein
MLKHLKGRDAKGILLIPPSLKEFTAVDPKFVDEVLDLGILFTIDGALVSFKFGSRDEVVSGLYAMLEDGVMGEDGVLSAKVRTQAEAVAYHRNKEAGAELYFALTVAEVMGYIDVESKVGKDILTFHGKLPKLEELEELDVPAVVESSSLATSEEAES